MIMTGKEKIEAAFSKAGTPEIPAVICYEGIFIRDHWNQIFASPWWAANVPDIDKQIELKHEMIEKIRQDWFRVHPFYSKQERQSLSIEVRNGNVFKKDKATGQEYQLSEPRIGGWSDKEQSHSIHPDHIVSSKAELDRLIPDPGKVNAKSLNSDGQANLAEALIRTFGAELFPFTHVNSPLWQIYNIWGFEGFMTMIADQPDLVEYACQRALIHVLLDLPTWSAIGVKAIWIEECLTDMISPDAFARLNVPFVRQLAEAIRTAGMKSIYYFCGNPEGKWKHILSIGADALALEESKKGFTIDIEDVVRRVNGHCTVLGNLDAVGVLQLGSETDLRNEIARQIAAGRHNNSRFIMSIGSPVSPETPTERVRLYCDLVHEIGDA